MKRNRLTGLGSLQAEVMELVWEMGEARVTQVMQRISKRRPVTYTTVLVAMQNLERKGWLSHRSAGRAYVYRPVRSRESVHAGLLKEMLKSAFRGDAKLLISQLLDVQPMSDKQLAEIRKLIEARRRELRRE